jgi:hypothetical protein
MWIYENEPFEGPTESDFGFVYIITEKDTGKKYIGKKFFWKPKTLPVTKTRKRKVKTKVQSDWKTYFGSSKEVKSLIEEKGEDNYERVILKICKSKGECSYWEAKLQFQYDVLLRDDFYNELIMCRINSSHVKELIHN